MTEESIRRLFTKRFGRAPEVIARAPGRVEFIGNHTDYNGGSVLGAAINRYVWVAIASSAQRRMQLVSGEEGTMVETVPGGIDTRATGPDHAYPVACQIIIRSGESISRNITPRRSVARRVRPNRAPN